MAVSSNNKRLAKNTLMLYVRTFITLIVSLFTSRIVLDTLGVDDYGIYNIVGGFVSMFSILSGVLVSATQRFMNFELGRKKNSRANEVFGAAMGIHIGLAIVLLILFESFGLWFLNYRLNIPVDRMTAANWVFQCSLITFVVNVLSSPYNATIIAHEKMSAFAYISLFDVFLKLGVAYFLYLSGFDKLIVYAVLHVLVAISIRFIYSSYCTRNFEETKFHVSRDKSLYKEMTGFASMTFLGRFASILSNQGVNIILNLFFGVTVNAARGIATQVNSAVVKFVSDFTTALNPQITKKYAEDDKEGMYRLCCTGAKFSFFMLLLVATPIFFRTPYILDIWLKNFPPETVIFVRLTILVSLCTVLSQPLITGILSTGNIKTMCLLIGGIHILTLPLSYIVLKFGAPSYSIYIVAFVIEITLLLTRLIIMCKLINLKIRVYFKEVIVRIIPILTIVFTTSYLLNIFFHDNLLGLLFMVISEVIICSISICTIGLKTSERKLIVDFIRNKIRK